MWLENLHIISIRIVHIRSHACVRLGGWKPVVVMPLLSASLQLSEPFFSVPPNLASQIVLCHLWLKFDEWLVVRDITPTTIYLVLARTHHHAGCTLFWLRKYVWYMVGTCLSGVWVSFKGFVSWSSQLLLPPNPPSQYCRFLDSFPPSGFVLWVLVFWELLLQSDALGEPHGGTSLSQIPGENGSNCE